MQKVYETKYTWWVVAIMIVIVLLYPTFMLFKGFSWIMTVVSIVVAAFFLDFLLHVSYTIDGDKLKLRAGLFHSTLEKLLSDNLSSPSENTEIKILDDKIILTINDATDDVRIYTFDKANHRLLGYRIERNSKEIIRSAAINYGPVNIDSHIPENIKFVDVNNIKGAYANLSAEEVATITLAALKAWDTNVIEKVFVLYPLDLIKSQLAESEIVRIGTPTEGRYKTVVPYCLRLRDGSVHYGNLSLLKVEGSGWIIDGGI